MCSYLFFLLKMELLNTRESKWKRYRNETRSIREVLFGCECGVYLIFSFSFSCWMSTDGTLIWTFTIPIIIVVAVCAFYYNQNNFFKLLLISQYSRR